MSDTYTLAHSASALIRNEPVQARSTARLAALLDAAAAVVDEIGYERLTTAMVAERAGASIGTVYRYFPDRIAVLQSLAARNVERVGDRAVELIRDSTSESWLAAMTSVFQMLTEAFRSEPGFASLRLGDVLDLRPAEGAPHNTVASDRMFDALLERYSLKADAGARHAFRSAIEVSDALLARAFARDQRGDAQYLDTARDVVQHLMEPHLA